MPQKPQARYNQNRTVVVYFGPTKQDYLKLVQAENHQAYIEFIQKPLQRQITHEQLLDDNYFGG